MSMEQVVLLVSRDALLPLDACSSIPDDVVLLVCNALSYLRGRARDLLRLWIEVEGSKCSSWACSSLPPPWILRFPDLLEKVWGLDRLIAYDLDNFKSPSDLLVYESYLKKFYDSNDHYQSNETNKILQCLEKEKALASEWDTEGPRLIPFDTELSINIQEYMSNIVNDAGNELTRPFVACAAACITQEANLMMEWLKQESNVCLEEVYLSSEIRKTALDLLIYKGNSVHSAAVLLGITREAKALLLSANCMESTDISLGIRTCGLHFLDDKLFELKMGACSAQTRSKSTDMNISSDEEGTD